ncbi:MAG: 50S ribosomal protein L24 [Burkholderiaceae bacterium]|jgi:large subunit ribosomal protein L24|nr:MAG: 50S ribosomal protein L24 [Betaproteobacteria bacterium TMED100]|tara:strand:- start:792 stop:1115 length:324 start_codon:yes stop_codon:yes gene_type:complete
MKKLIKGDEVIVIAGKDKGKKGVITERFSNDRLIVEGINQVKKHQKPNPNNNETGGIVSKSMPIHQSNLAIYNPETQKADKVSIKELDTGEKVRVFSSSGSQLQTSK